MSEHELHAIARRWAWRIAVLVWLCAILALVLF